MIALPEYKEAKHVAIYLSMPKAELDTRTIVLHSLQANKRVFVPYIYSLGCKSLHKPQSVMDMVSLNSQEDYESLQSNAWGIPTPAPSSIEERANCLGDSEITLDEGTDRKALDVIILPGVAFDQQLARLGHGKGYYDFFLQRYQQAHVLKKGPNAPMPFLGKSMLC